MNRYSKLVIMLSIASLVMYELNLLASIAIAVTALIVAIFGVKDDKTTSRVLQVNILLGSVLALRGVLTIIVDMIEYFARLDGQYYNSVLNSNIAGFRYVMSAMYLIFILSFLVLSIVMFALDRDIPVADKLANKIVGATSKAKDRKSEKADKVEIEEPSEK